MLMLDKQFLSTFYFQCDKFYLFACLLIEILFDEGAQVCDEIRINVRYGSVSFYNLLL